MRIVTPLSWLCHRGMASTRLVPAYGSISAGWRYGSNSKDQPIDPIRGQMLASETELASRHIPEAVKQAYSIVVTVNERNDIHAFKVAVTEEPLFTIIKADKRARIQETVISSEAMMPGGPYDLWREGEDSHRVKDLVGAFARSSKLPKMLRRRDILNTVSQGVLSGILVAQVVRPDRTTKTFWRTEVDQHVFEDPSLEVLLPESATLSDIGYALLGFDALPGLWPSGEVLVQDIHNYFSGEHTVAVPREGYEDTFFIPGCDPSSVDGAIADAVAQGLLWMTNGPASILGEPVPAGVLSPSAKLRPPPDPIAPDELMPASIPDAWLEGKTNALAIATALSSLRGVALPWSSVRTVIDSAIRTRWLELSKESAEWPTDLVGAQHIILQAPTIDTIRDPGGKPYVQLPLGVLVAEAPLEANGIQDLADQIPDIAQAAVGSALKFNVRIELGGDAAPDPEVVGKINALLSEVSDDLKLA